VNSGEKEVIKKLSQMIFWIQNDKIRRGKKKTLFFAENCNCRPLFSLQLQRVRKNPSS
jgi:hypothetical protein